MAGNPVCGPGLRSDERERKSAVFSATGGRMLFATGLEGGGGGSFRMIGVAQRIAHISLIPLWLSPV